MTKIKILFAGQMVILKNFLAEFVNVNVMKAFSGLFSNIKILPKSNQSVLKILD